MEVARLCNGKLDIYSGDDGLVLPILALGGIGVISVASNICPEYMHDMCYHYFNGNIEKCREMQFKLNPLVDALFSEVNPIPVKCAAKLLGLISSDYMRLPLTPSTKEDYIRSELIKFGYNI